MSDFPDAIFTPRTIENRAGVVYDANNTKTLYAEDIEAITGEIAGIETILGLNPEGAFTSVVDRLEDIEADILTMPVKATGAEVKTGTNDTKFATPLAIANVLHLTLAGAKFYNGEVAGVTNATYVDLPAPDGGTIDDTNIFSGIVFLSRVATSVATVDALYIVRVSTTNAHEIIPIYEGAGSTAPRLIWDSNKIRVKSNSSASSVTHRFIALCQYFT